MRALRCARVPLRALRGRGISRVGFTGIRHDARLLVLRIRERQVPACGLQADEIRKERHLLEPDRKLQVAARHMLGERARELGDLVARELHDPGRRALVRRPRLHVPVVGIVQPEVTRMQFQARSPSIQQQLHPLGAGLRIIAGHARQPRPWG